MQRMKWTRPITLWTLVLMMVSVLSACGQSSEDTASGDSAASPAGQVELSFMTTWSETDPFTGVYYKNAMAFQEANPDIKLKIETTPYNDYPVKLKTAAAAGQLTDLILMISGGATLEPIARSGALMPIDDMMGNWPEDFLPKAKIADYNIDGKQYAIPGEISYSTMIYYNKKILSDAGYTEFPTDYEGFKKLIGDLKAANITPIAVGNKTGSILAASLLSPLNERISGPDVYTKLAAGEMKFTDPEFVEALTDVKELYSMGAFNTDLNNIDNVQATDLFLSGKTAMYLDGSWGAKQISQDKAADFEAGFALFPAIAGGKGSISAVPGGTNQGVVLNAKLDGAKKAAAEKFLKFMYSKESYQNVIKDGNMVPANIETPSDVDPLFSEMMKVSSSVTRLYPVFDAAMPATVSTAAKNGLQGLTSPGAADPKSLAAELDKELNQ